MITNATYKNKCKIAGIGRLNIFFCPSATNTIVFIRSPLLSFIEISLPNYVDALAADFTINITPIYDGTVKGVYSATEVVNGTFRIYGTPGKVHWTVWGKRHDIEVEPDVITTTVQGAGPYKWI